MAERVPRVSVIVPAHNCAEYTLETVESILGQTYTDYQLLVVDDGSTDHTRVALQKFGDRIQYIYKENGGACSARNLGICMSKGEFVACLDCDDLWLPEKLACSVLKLEENPEAAFVYTGCYMIDLEGNIIDQVRNLCEPNGNPYLSILGDGAIPAPTVVMRRSCLEKVGLFDEKIFIPADKDLWLRLSRHYPICRIEQPLSKYRMASNYTLKNIRLSLDENLYVLEKQFDGNCDISDRAKDRYRQQVLNIHAMMYRKVGDVNNAKKLLWRAMTEYSFTVSLGLNWAISLLGIRAWNGIANLRSAMLGFRYRE